MKKYIFLIAVFLVTRLASTAQSAPKTAYEIVSNAVTLARQQHKKALIMFHASWCGWCRKMDASIDDPSCKNYFDSNFVIDHITVFEQGKKVPLDNPGGQDLYEKYGGDNGIPFWLIFDEDGNLLANSNYHSAGDTSSKPQNIGCPSTEEEVSYFVSLLKKYTSISDEQALAVHQRFRKNEIKVNGTSIK